MNTNIDNLDSFIDELIIEKNPLFNPNLIQLTEDINSRFNDFLSTNGIPYTLRSPVRPLTDINDLHGLLDLLEASNTEEDKYEYMKLILKHHWVK